jgi:hypothetical protein
VVKPITVAGDKEETLLDRRAATMMMLLGGIEAFIYANTGRTGVGQFADTTIILELRVVVRSLWWRFSYFVTWGLFARQAFVGQLHLELHFRSTVQGDMRARPCEGAIRGQKG